MPEAASEAVTEGVRVTVRTQYLPEESSPRALRFVFAYHVRIANEGSATVRLSTRHWIIRDAEGHVEEVRGEGVVGQKPTLRPGEHFDYSSRCILKTPFGSMEGTYQMLRAGGVQFDAAIARFELALPRTMVN